MPSQKKSSVDAFGVFQEVLGKAPTGVREMTLVFGERTMGENTQIVSVLQDETVIYPLTELWRPGLKRAIACYVLIQERDDGQRRGFAMPREMRDAIRRGEILPPTNSIKVVEFRKGDDGKLFGFAANGKRVIVPEGSGVKITDEEIQNDTPVAVMVTEKMSAFLARARVKNEVVEILTGQSEQSVTALTRVIEAVGAGLESLHATLVFVGDRYYDAAMELGVDKMATRKQIKATHRNLSREFHPDKRLANERKLLRGKPVSEERRAEITHEFQVIQASYERLLLLRAREDAANRYAQAGADALGKRLVEDTYTGMEVLGYLQTAREAKSENGNSEELVASGLAAIGYPDVGADASLSREVAVTLAGWLVKTRTEAAKDKAKDKKPATPRAETAQSEAAPAKKAAAKAPAKAKEPASTAK